MRISFILSSLRLSGGVRAVIEISNRLFQRGHQVSLVVPGGTIDPDVAAMVAVGIEIKESRIRFSPGINGLKLLGLSWSLANAVSPSDVVISTHTPTTAPVFLATRLLKRGQPIWYFLDYPEMFAQRPIETWLMRHALSWHRGALAISEFCRQVLVQPNSHKVVINVSIGLSNPEAFQRPKSKVEREQLWHGEKPVLFLGDDRPRKGLAEFLQAAERVCQQEPQAVFWIVSKKNLTIPDSIPYRLITRPTDYELAELYRTCAAFVSASWVEGFGLPPLEAMACGAPVVMTDSGGSREFAQPMENCILVPIRDPKALAEGILTVFHNAALEERFRRNGPLTAARFNWNTTVDQFEQALINWSK
jgi:glycosyltransferase involved in cell wall biosynthesis